MTKEIWINLPVRNVQKSKAFFTEIGFAFHEHGDPNSACIIVGEKNIPVMLFPEEMFKNFVRAELADVSNASEVLFSFDAQSKDEVDDMAAKVEKAGGNAFSKPETIQDWMYGFAFADLDGHRWNMLYMDHSKMPH